MDRDVRKGIETYIFGFSYPEIYSHTQKGSTKAYGIFAINQPYIEGANAPASISSSITLPESNPFKDHQEREL